MSIGGHDLTHPINVYGTTADEAFALLVKAGATVTQPAPPPVVTPPTTSPPTGISGGLDGV